MKEYTQGNTILIPFFALFGDLCFSSVMVEMTHSFIKWNSFDELVSRTCQTICSSTFFTAIVF